MIKVVFVSNYFNHHERCFCDEMHRNPDVDFKFIQTQEMTDERKKLGWGIDTDEYPYVLSAYASPEAYEQCIRLCNECDALILGSAPYDFVADRVKKNKLTFYYAERLFRKGIWHMLNPRTFLTVMHRFIVPGRKSNFYLLAASAYTANDTARIFAFKDRRFKWGHFIEVGTTAKRSKSGDNKIRLLWAARLIPLKHPEYAVRLAKQLKAQGIDFHLDIIGNGELDDELNKYIAANDLGDVVTMLGAKKPTEVRRNMDQADIFLFTSDFNEGWGAVLGEAMTSGCAVVTSHGIGATPFLVKDGENGLIYKTGDFESFENKVLKLILHPEIRQQFSENAMATMQNVWNARTGAKRFYALCKSLIDNGMPVFFDNGPISKADKLRNNWFKDDSI